MICGNAGFHFRANRKGINCGITFDVTARTSKSLYTMYSVPSIVFVDEPAHFPPSSLQNSALLPVLPEIFQIGGLLVGLPRSSLIRSSSKETPASSRPVSDPPREHSDRLGASLTMDLLLRRREEYRHSNQAHGSKTNPPPRPYPCHRSAPISDLKACIAPPTLPHLPLPSCHTLPPPPALSRRGNEPRAPAPRR